ncbi:MAG: 2-phosphosulfolactate phosphatase [Gemmatimonadota bacterium]|nr:2-phosphosulfolactate phosphatase [Gemmatimonadota bacterium]
MKLSVYFTPLGVKPHDIQDRPVLVVDVLRTTTTIVAALSNGAKAVVPVVDHEDALRLAQNLERDAVLLCGERNMQKIPGFELGNSPLEMKPSVVKGKTLVMATTNGTPAIVAAESGKPVLIGAVTNFSAIVEEGRRIFEEAQELHILCSGRERMFALEDAYTAGRFAQAIVPPRLRRSADVNDAAIAALELVRRYGDQWKQAITSSAGARGLKQAKFRNDLVAAMELDTYSVVPQYADRLVTIPNRG